VYIIDRAVSLGSHMRPLCTEPSAYELFPVNEAAWESGDFSLTIQTSVSGPGSDPQSPYGRLCQAALLIGKMFRYSARAETRKLKGEPRDFADVLNLTETAKALSSYVTAELRAEPSLYFSMLPSRAFAASVVMKVVCACNSDSAPSIMTDQLWNEEDLSMQMAAMENLKKTLEYIRDSCLELYTYVSREEEMVKTSPLVMDAIYTAATVFSWTSRENGDGLLNPNLDITKKCLGRLSTRWRLGSEYLKALEHHELTKIMDHDSVRRRHAQTEMLVVDMNTML
jgi:hypothetical protein